jgi:hypothetical protein
MTTFTTEDKEQVIKELGAYIELEQRMEAYRVQIVELRAEVFKLRRKLAELEFND